MTARLGPAFVAGPLALGLLATSCGGIDDTTAGTTRATDTTPVTAADEPADEPASSLELTVRDDTG